MNIFKYLKKKNTKSDVNNTFKDFSEDFTKEEKVKEEKVKEEKVETPINQVDKIYDDYSNVKIQFQEINNIAWNIKTLPECAYHYDTNERVNLNNKINWPKNLIIPLEKDKYGVKTSIYIDVNTLGEYLTILYNFYNTPVTLNDLKNHREAIHSPGGYLDHIKMYKILISNGKIVYWSDLMGNRIYFDGICNDELQLTT